MKAIGGLFVTLVYMFLFLPMVVLVVLSFNTAPRGAVWQGFTFSWYRKLFMNQAILDALATSLEVAVQATALSLVLGLCVGVISVRGRRRERTVLRHTSTLPIIFPEIVQGLSLLCFFVLIGIPLGKFSIVIAHSAFGSAYVATLVRSRILSIDPLLEEAASDLGAGPWKIIFDILIPQLWPALISGMLMVFTLSFDDFIISFFTSGAGATVLPLKIYSMLKFGVSPEVNALCALILMTSFFLVSLAFWTQNRKVTQ